MIGKWQDSAPRRAREPAPAALPALTRLLQAAALRPPGRKRDTPRSSETEQA